MADEKTRTLVVTMNDGSKRLVENVPADAKVTFGEMHGGGKGHGMWSTETTLRVYTNQQNQLAVFVGVKEFMDTQLRVKKRKVVKAEQKKKMKDDGTTMSIDQSVEEVEDWVEERF